MKELIPILLQFVSSHQIPGGHILWIAHNARSFDVPFLIKEFNRCSVDIPSNWLFLDTLPLAREVMKSEGLFLYLFMFPTFVIEEIPLSLSINFVNRIETFKGITASPSRALWNSADWFSS